MPPRKSEFMLPRYNEGDFMLVTTLAFSTRLRQLQLLRQPTIATENGKRVMKIQFALAAGVAAAAICGSAFAATPVQGLSRLYASDVQGDAQAVVHTAPSAYAWLASLNGSGWATEKNEADAAKFKAATATLSAAQSAPAPITGTPAPYKAAAGGEAAGATFKTIAAGSTVMELYLPGTANEMTIMYHMDGPNTLLANHFCGARNVPQWKFVKSDKPGVIAFINDGGTNIDPKVDAYAYAVTYTVIDKDHYAEDQTASIAGKHTTFHSVHYRLPATPIQSASAE